MMTKFIFIVTLLSPDQVEVKYPVFSPTIEICESSQRRIIDAFKHSVNTLKNITVCLPTEEYNEY